MELVTGHQAGPHITAAQVSRFIQGITVMDDTTVYRLNEGNNCAITTTDLNLTIDTGEMVLHGFHVTNETPYDIGIDPVSDASKTRIDKIVLEITEDMTTGIQTASVVVVQGTEATSPVPPATPSTPSSPTEIFLGVGVIAQITATDSTISVLTDLTELYAGSYVSKEDFDTGMSNIAPIEETSTASRPYSVGGHLIYNGILYKVDANIAQGATLVPGGNISLSPDVEAQIGALNSALGDQVTSELYGSLRLVRKGKMRQLITSYGLMSGITNQTIPSGDRPPYTVNAPCVFSNNAMSSQLGYGVMYVDSNGAITFSTPGITPGSTDRCATLITWFLNN